MSPGIDIVIKVGGALLRDLRLFALAVESIDQLACGAGRVGDTLSHGRRSLNAAAGRPTAARGDDRSMTCLIVPGGGPFADAVREVDGHVTLGDDVSHWAAIRAMDQYAHILAERSSRGTIVDDVGDAPAVSASGRVPILAPYRWLRAVDPLPHSWSVTSDSIAAWIALAEHAQELVLVKPIAGAQAAVADSYLPRLLDDAAAVGRPLTVRICTPDALVETVAGCHGRAV